MRLRDMNEMGAIDSGSQSDHGENERTQAILLADALIELGTPVSLVRVMVCLHLNGETTSKNLQQSCELRQPEISTAIKRLVELSLVETKRSGSEGRGRPSHIYTLCEPLATCVGVLLNDAEKQIITLQRGIGNVQRITRSL